MVYMNVKIQRTSFMELSLLGRLSCQVIAARSQQGMQIARIHVATQTYSYRTQASGQRRVRDSESFIGRTQGGQPAGREFARSFADGQAISCGANRITAEVKAMEVEVKIRLPDRAAYDKVAAALASQPGCPGRTASHAQANYFFDGPNRELNSRRVVLRLRTYNGDQKATITLKGQQILENGIGRASEVEEDVSPAAAASFLADPKAMVSVPLIKTTAEKFGLTSLMSLGGFRNQRDCYVWEGHTLELDETHFQHGILYEIEVETDQPEMLRGKLEAFLTSLGIPYSYSKTSKFANFINKTLL